MKVYLDENLVPFFPAHFIEEQKLGILRSEDSLGKVKGLIIYPELNTHRTPSLKAVFTGLGLNVVFVSLPVEGVWYLDEPEVRQRKWAEVFKKCRQQTEAFAYRCDLNASRLRNISA